MRCVCISGWYGFSNWLLYYRNWNKNDGRFIWFSMVESRKANNIEQKLSEIEKYAEVELI